MVRMDLSGFTPKNTGCVRADPARPSVPLERLVLIADGRTDRVALEEVLQGAWARLPSSSPNAHVSGTALTVLVCAGRAVDDARARVAVVLRAGVRQKEEAAQVRHMNAAGTPPARASRPASTRWPPIVCASASVRCRRGPVIRIF